MQRLWLRLHRYNLRERSNRFVFQPSVSPTYNDNEILVTTLPVMYPVYKVCLELYIWAAQASWENVFHFTLGSNTGDGHRQPALWIMKDGNSAKLLLTASVSGNPATHVFSIVDKDSWISI